MHDQLRGAVLAERATPLLVAAVRAAGMQTVLLPGLYCADVAGALADAGFALRYYDLDATLTPCPTPSGMAAATLIWYHPFGLYRPPPPGTLLIVDACHALRTLASRPVWPGITVVNFRKELGWSCGAAAAGLPAGVGGVSPPTSTVVPRMQDFACAVAEGRTATEMAKERLANRLPAIRDGDVLTHLPLLSDTRDTVIDGLRTAGLDAWRWLEPLPDVESSNLVISDALRQRLLLVPLPPGMDAVPILDRLAREDLLPWPRQ